MKGASCLDKEWKDIMSDFFTAILKFLSNISTKVVLLSVCGVSWFLLAAPDFALSFLGLFNFRDSQRAVIGLTALISTTILMVLLGMWLWGCVRSWRMYSGKDARRRLDAMGEWNKALIRQLYETPSHSQKLPLQNANVQALLSENIIIHSPLGDAIGFDCVLQSWVVQYLDEHQEYLAGIKKFDRPFPPQFPL